LYRFGNYALESHISDQFLAALHNLQTTVPKTFPMPAVKVIANAPQNVTLAVARRILVPPALADRAQKSEKSQRCSGHHENEFASKRYDGIAAPRENDAADVSAACTGRAVVIAEISSSMR
jgi:hypothetical protein